MCEVLVARIQRNPGALSASRTPDFASLHPGYEDGGFESISGSGSATKISTAAITITKRNALGTPFHSIDCHMPNHSPPIDMKPTCQMRKPSVRPTIANVLA